VHFADRIVCKICAAPEEAKRPDGLKLSWMCGPRPVDKERVCKVLWRHARPFALRYRFKANKEKYSKIVKKRTLRRILGDSPVPDFLREPVFGALADFEMQPKGNLWLAFRKGVFDETQFRLLAVACAAETAQVASLYAAFPVAYDVFNDADNCVKENTDTRLQQRHLSFVRQNAYLLQEAMTGSEFVPVVQRRAADVLFAVCFPDARDAAVVSCNWTFETFTMSGMGDEVALATLNDILRTVAENILSRFTKPELEHWSGLEE